MGEKEWEHWQGVMMFSASGNSSRAVFARLSLKRHPGNGTQETVRLRDPILPIWLAPELQKE